jgi:bacillithiol biosynthesis cysteine-adding enzyme BshC
VTSFCPAWLAGDARALALLPAHFRDADARAQSVRRASARPVAAAVMDVVRAQNAALPASAARDRNVDALAQPGTTCVVTGQQVGLFLGPLYTVYKAASAIACARALERETGTRCVPVFWLQTEDHDVAEIDHVFVPRATGDPLRLSVQSGAHGERAPVAHVSLGPDVTGAVEALRAELGSHPHAQAHLDVLSRAYVPAASFGAAFAHVLAHLFRDDGLVFLDPRDARLAPHAAPIHARALRDARAIADALAERARAVEASGFDKQVHVREGAPLSFFSPDDVDGPRYRLDPHASGYTLVGADRPPLTEATLQDALAREPLRFTTSALLRPILQDTWLPTAAYVGGPAEMAYFAQLGPLYAHFDMAMPLPVPRARFRVLDDRARALLDKLALAPDDVATPRDALLARLATPAAEGEAPDVIERNLRAAIDAELARVAPAMSALDPSLAKAITNTGDVVHDAVAKLVAKYGRALARRDQSTVERVDRLRAMLLPNGEPQERVFGVSYYACRFGDAFVRGIVDAVEPFAAAHKDVTP